MKKLWVVLLAIISLCISDSNHAQTSDKDSSSFVRDRSFNFYFVNGFALGYKLNIIERSVMKLVLDFKGTYLDRDKWQNDDPSEYSEKRDNINLAFYGAYCYSLYKNTYIDICIGFGPYYNLNFSSNTGTEFVKDTLNTTVRRYHSDSYNAFGALSLFGVEGFISSHISLIAEAQLTGSYRWEKSYSESTRNSQGIEIVQYVGEARTNSWFVDVNFVRLGIGIYF